MRFRVQRRTSFLFAAIVAAGYAHPADAQVRVRVLGTFPSGNTITLPRNQNFYLHLHYDTDHPIRIWIHPYFRGKEINAGSSPSRTYDGSGEALGWFFLFTPNTRVDEIRIAAGDGTFKGTRVAATYPVQIIGSSQAAAKQGEPAWVTRLNALDAAAQKAAYDAEMNKPLSVGDIVFFSGFMLIMLAIGVLGFAAPAWGLWRWRGGWRVAAVVPAALMSFVVLRLLIDTGRDSTSHNLWPFEILQVGALSVVVMAALAAARKLTGASRAS